MVRAGGANVHVSDLDRLCQRLPAVLSLIYQLRFSRVGVDDAYELCIETKDPVAPGELLALTNHVKHLYLEITEEVRDYTRQGFLRHFRLSLLPPGSLHGSAKTGKIRRV